MKLGFCNTCVRIHNLPDHLKGELKEIEKFDKAGIEAYDEKDNDPFGLVGNTGTKEKGGLSRAEDVDFSQLTPGQQSIYKKKKNKKHEPPPGVGTILEPISEEVVSQEELERLEHVLSFIQNHIFMRFQTRMSVKFFTSLNFLLVPLIAMATPSGYAPDLIGEQWDPKNPFDFSNNHTSRYFIAGIAYLVMDLVEWILISWFAVKKSNSFQQRSEYFYGMATDKDLRVVMILWITFTGVFMYHTIWNPFQEIFKINLVREKYGVTPEPGMSGPSFSGWTQAYAVCYDMDHPGV